MYEAPQDPALTQNRQNLTEHLSLLQWSCYLWSVHSLRLFCGSKYRLGDPLRKEEPDSVSEQEQRVLCSCRIRGVQWWGKKWFPASEPLCIFKSSCHIPLKSKTPDNNTLRDFLWVKWWITHDTRASQIWLTSQCLEVRTSFRRCLTFGIGNFSHPQLEHTAHYVLKLLLLSIAFTWAHFLQQTSLLHSGLICFVIMNSVATNKQIWHNPPMHMDKTVELGPVIAYAYF